MMSLSSNSKPVTQIVVGRRSTLVEPGGAILGGPERMRDFAV